MFKNKKKNFSLNINLIVLVYKHQASHYFFWNKKILYLIFYT